MRSRCLAVDAFATDIEQKDDLSIRVGLCDAYSSLMQTAMLLWIAGAVAATVIVILFVFSRQQRRPPDLGSVSTAWTTEHNATTHGRDSS